MGCGASNPGTLAVPNGRGFETHGTNLRIEATGPGQNFVVKHGDIPKCPAKGLIVKTSHTGLCHSDVHIWQNKIKLSEDVIVGMETMNPAFKWPAILGHEISGTVHEVGPVGVEKAPKLRPGDRVVVFSWIGCGQCSWCAVGMNNFCAHSYVHDLGVGTDGGFQGYVAVPSKQYAVKLPGGIPMHEACLFGCSAVTAYNICLKARPSIQRAARITGEAKLLVVGIGGIGMWTLQIARAMFPAKTKIFVADCGGADKLEAAKTLGADETIDWPRDGDDNEIIERTKQATLGIDAAVDTVSIGTTLNRILNCTNKGATIVAPGMSGGIFSIPLLLLTLRDITLTGVYTGNPSDIRDFIDFYTKHKLRTPPLEKVTPEGVDDAMNRLHKGQLLGRAIIQF